MGTTLRILALFTVYGGIAFAGGQVVGLFAEDPSVAEDRATAEQGERTVERITRVSMSPELLSRARDHLSDRCDFMRDLEASLSAVDVTLLQVRAGPGGLRIEGDASVGEIVAVGRACASDEAYLDELDLSLVSRDGTVTLETHHPDRRGWGSGHAGIDLVVLVPAGMVVDVDDSSGGMVVQGTGSVRIDDSSGSIRLAGIQGDAEIHDSSGGIEIDGVSGRLSIEDGSGGIDIRSVDGDVRLRDGSGSIDVTEAGSHVVVEADGSGSISVRDVAGDFRVVRDGSGGIRHADVRGVVEIPADERRR